MELAYLKGEPRVAAGSRAAARLRKSGKVPGVMYGHGEETISFAVAQHELELLLQHKAHLLELELNGVKRPVLVKEVQYDYLGTTPVHVDLARVSLDERVRIRVKIELRGEPEGAKEGGVVDQTLADLEIECLVTQIPESLRANIDALKLGDSLHVSDVPLPEGVVSMQAGDLVVCTVRAPLEEAVAPEAVEAEAAATAEPEVIGRKEKEAEAEETEQ